MSATSRNSSASWYPPGPKNVPDDLTALPPGYVRQVIIVLLCLYLFVLVYLALVVGSAGLLYWTIVGVPWYLEGVQGRPAAAYLFFVKLPVVLCATMLCLFLVKGLFKRTRQSKDTLLELYPEEHPRLFEFIQELCDEVEAPFPKRVYVDHDVNAAVFYNTSVLGLFWPVRKNLLIGLGLVNMLNLSEFKAVLAHEMGHFSQKSMKLSQYVYVAHRIIVAMVYDRDWWDDFLDRWKTLDVRASWPAYILGWLTGLLRKFLQGLFVLILKAERKLSRAMEYHADKVAVFAAGSEAIVRGLYKLGPGLEALHSALNDLYWASERQLYSRDLFYHQTKALEHLRRAKRDPNYGVPPPVPKDPRLRKPLFSADKKKRTDPWDTHPPDYLREQKACDPYVVAPLDERSPWLLFGESPDDVQQLRQQMTLRVYRYVLGIRTKKLPLQPPEQVQQEIDAEHEVLTFDPKYQGLYDGRYLYSEHLDEWVQEAESGAGPVHRWKTQVDEIYRQDWHALVQRWEKLIEDKQTVDAICEGKKRPKSRKFKALDRTWPVRKAREVQGQIDAELNRINEQFERADKAVFLSHYLMAKQLSPQAAQSLVYYYRWATRLEGWCKQLREWSGLIEAIEFVLDVDADFGREQGREIVATFLEIRRELGPVYGAMCRERAPKMIGLTDQPRVASVLFPQGVVPPEPDEEEGLPLGEWMGKLAHQLSSASDRAHRLYARTVGTILAMQEEIQRRWQSSQTRPSGKAPRP